MKWQSFLAFSSVVQLATGLKLIDESEDNGVICYTYLSTYLAAIDVETAAPAPILPSTRGILPPYFTNRSTSAIPSFTFPADRESSTVLQDSDSTVALLTSSVAIPTEVTLLTSSDVAVPTEFTDLFSPTASILSKVSTTSSQAEATGQAVIFFIAPDTANERRSLVKRVIPGGFVNGVNPVDVCTDADVFQLSDGQLLDNESPVYYNGEPYKPFGSDGTPPNGAITREFTSVGGTLVFTSSSLPSTRFCQDDGGQVYITFGSSPPGCDPVILQVYTVEQCRNGEIPGPDQSGSVSSDMAQSPVTASTAISISIVSSESQESTSAMLVKPTDASLSSDTSPVATETQSTATTDEAVIVTADSSSSDPPSQSSLFTSSLFLTSPTTSTTESQSVPLFPTSSSTDSIVATASEVMSSSELPAETSSSIALSTDSSATEPSTEGTTASISTTALSQESETLTQLDTTTTEEATETVETTTTAEETATTAGDTTSFESTEAAETTNTAEDTTTTAEETTTAAATTTTGCDSETVLTTVALLNPTPIYVGSLDVDGDSVSVELPFNVAGSGSNIVYVSTYGVITVGSNFFDVDWANSQLPTEGLPPIAVCPYWDDLVLRRANGDTVVYEVFEGQHGTQATFEWLVTRHPNNGLYHFTSTFYQDFPDVSRFSYYTTEEKGSGATIGLQNTDSGTSLQVSYNEENSASDGVSVFFSSTGRNVEYRSFDNTECGKGDPPDDSSLFSTDQ